MQHCSDIKYRFKTAIAIALLLILGKLSGIAQPLVADGGISQTICDGSSTMIGGSPTANYGSPGYTYSWAPSTGLSSTIVSNPTASPTSTTTYTISVTDAALTVATATVTITVKPLPTVNPTFSAFVCNGATVGSTTFISTPAGATFNWTNSNPSIGLAASGIGSVPSFTAINSGSTTIGATISVTPTLAGCTGPAYNYSITVKPTPIGTSTPSSQTRCSGVNSNFVLNSTVSGTTYSWTTTGSGVTGNTAGSGTVISQSVTNTITTSGTANYYITPTAAGCAGTAFNATLTVDPIPVATASSTSETRCSGDTVSFSVSSNVSGTTFSWTTSISNVSGATVSGTGNYVLDTLTATTSSAGTVAYLFTPVAAGCTGSAVFPFVTVNPMPDATFSYISPACQNTPNIFPSFGPGASAGNFTSAPAGLVINSATGEIDLTASVAGGYSITNTIAASGGCPSTNSNTGFTLNPFVDPTITDIASVCMGGAPFNFAAASAGGNWSGTGITNSSAGTFDPVVAGIGTFTITYQSSGPCFFMDTTVISVTSTDIYGQVTYSGGNISSGANTVVLFNYVPSFVSFDTAQISSIDASGYFQFTSVPIGDYLIKVFADTLVYPATVPSYYNNEYLWDSSMVMTHGGCVVDTADVLMVEGIPLVGPGILGGLVTEGTGFVRAPGEPIPGIDVKLGKNPGGAMITNTQTDPLGYYSFTDIPVNGPGEYYTVYIDIPGLQRDSTYNIVVTSTNFSFLQLDYVADSNSVYPVFPVSVTIDNSEPADGDLFSVFPNPTEAVANIMYTLNAPADVELKVYDILGKELQSLVNKNQQAGDYRINSSQLKAGIYFINLKVNDNSNTIRLVVTD